MKAKVKPKSTDAYLYQQVVPFKPSKGAIRKIEIVEAAIRVIAREGVDRLTFESVGKLSQMGKSHVAYHFPNRDEIVMAAITYVYAIGQGTVVEHLNLEPNPDKKLKAYIRGAFEWIDAHPDHIAVMALLLSLGSVTKGFRSRQSEIRSIGAKRIEAIVGGMKGPKHSATELKEISETIQAIILGNILYYGASDMGVSLNELGDRTYRMALGLLKKRNRS